MNPSRSGFVLVSVLWIVALLTVITISYHYRARLEVRAARYSLDTSQARLAARAAVERGILELRNKAVLAELEQVPGQPPVPPATSLAQSWAQPRNLYHEGDYLSPGPHFDNDEATYHAEDLERYININSENEATLEALPGMSLPVLRRLNYRRTGNPESGAGPRPFQHIAELRAIRGIDDDAWYGDGDAPGLRDVITTYGDGRVNINTAPGAVLRCLPDVSPDTVDDLLAARNGPDGVAGTGDDRTFRDWTQFGELTQIQGGTLQAFQRFCKFNSNYFKISAEATRRGGMIRSHCAAVVYLPDGSNVANVLSWSEESLGSP